MIYEIGNREDAGISMHVVGVDEKEALRRARIIFGSGGYIIRIVPSSEDDE